MAEKPVFTDTTGREWRLEITGQTLKDVRELCDVRIGEWAKDNFKLFAQLLGDVEKLIDVLFVMVKPEADAAGITDIAFGRSLNGDVVEAAAAALVVAFANFSPSQARPLILALSKKGKEYMRILTTDAMKKLDEIDVQAMASQTLKNSAGNSPASSESIPDPSRSAN